MSRRPRCEKGEKDADILEVYARAHRKPPHREHGCGGEEAEKRQTNERTKDACFKPREQSMERCGKEEEVGGGESLNSMLLPEQKLGVTERSAHCLGSLALSLSLSLSARGRPGGEGWERERERDR